MSTTSTDAPTVLVVDDHTDTREMVSLVFRDGGFHVCEAGSVADALQCLHDDCAPALILSDLAMPGTSGVEFIQYLREDVTLRTIPVIVVTGRDPSELSIEVDAILQKPVDPYALFEEAKRMIALAS